MKVAMIGASGLNSCEEPTDDGRAAGTEQQDECGRPQGSLRQDIESQATDESPNQSWLETHHDGDHDGPDQDQVRLSAADLEIRSYGQFEQGGHCRTDRSEQQGH